MPANGRQFGRCPGRPFLFFGPGLVHEPPQSLVLSFPLHQVSRLFQRSAGADLVHRPPQSLVLSFPLHQVSGLFQRSAGADLVHRPPQSLVLSFPLHQVSGPFQRSAGTDLVHKSQQNLVLSSPLHQVSGPFQRSAGADLVHRPPQGPVLSSPLHQVSGPFRRSAGNRGANSSGCRLPAGTRWKGDGRRLESRKGEWPRPFSFSSFPQSKASGGTPEAHELLFLCSISIQSISIS